MAFPKEAARLASRKASDTVWKHGRKQGLGEADGRTEEWSGVAAVTHGVGVADAGDVFARGAILHGEGSLVDHLASALSTEQAPYFTGTH